MIEKKDFLYSVSMRFFIALLVCITLHLEALTWTTPFDISNQRGWIPSIAVDGQGNTIVVWWVSAGAGSGVYAAMKPVGGVWSTPVEIAATTVGTTPLVVMNPSGYAMVLWGQQTGGSASASLFYATATFGGTWSSPVTLVNMAVDYTGTSQPYDLDMDDAGNVIAAWNFYNGSTSVIQAAVIPYLGSPVKTILSSGSYSSTFPNVSVNASGNGVVIWTAYIPGGRFTTYTQTAFYTNGTWGSTYSVTPVAGLYYGPQAIIDVASNVTVTWYENTGGGNQMQYAQHPFGGSWSSTGVIDNQITNVAALVATSTSDVIVMWTQAPSGSTRILRSTTIPLGGSPLSPTNVFSASSSISDYSLTIDAGNNAYAVWDVGSTLVQAKTASLYFGTSVWTDPTTLSTNNTGRTSNSVIASNKPYTAEVAWQLTVGSTRVIEVTSGSEGIIPIVPISIPLVIQGAQVLHRFPNEGDLINVLSWIEPNTDTIYGYQIARTTSSNIIGEVSIPQFQDHQRIPGVAYTYFITALTTSGNVVYSGSITIP